MHEFKLYLPEIFNYINVFIYLSIKSWNFIARSIMHFDSVKETKLKIINL